MDISEEVGASVDELLDQVKPTPTLTSDAVQLLAVALEVLRRKESERHVVSSTTIFVAAVDWSNDEDRSPPQAIKHMADELVDDRNFASLRDDFFARVDAQIEAVSDTEKPVLSATVADLLSHSAEVSSTRLLLDVLRNAGNNPASWLGRRIRQYRIDANHLIALLEAGQSTGSDEVDSEDGRTPIRKRVVKVTADLANGRYRYASGLLIGGRDLITTASAVRGAVAVTAKRPHEQALSVSWPDHTLGGDIDDFDVALLEVAGIEPLAPLQIARIDRDVPSGEQLIEGCWVVGYPESTAPDGTTVREALHLSGVVPPLSGKARGRHLSFRATRGLPPQDAASLRAGSPWSGLAGAPVFAGEEILGVVAYQTTGRGVGDLSFTPLDRILMADQAPIDAQSWQRRLQLAGVGFGGSLGAEDPFDRGQSDEDVNSEAARTQTDLGGEAPDQRLVDDGLAYADFSSDAIQARRSDEQRLLDRDRLGIASHVEAMALLMTSTDLTPPLAVGLFGDWGSGKSFFMRALQQEVERLTARARSSGVPQHELGVFTRVVQIEFNAWHYVDADLWASLGDYIFTNLRIGDEDDESAQQRRETFVKVLRAKGAALRQAEIERRQIEDLLSAAVAQHEGIHARRQANLSTLDIARAAVTVDKGTKGDVDKLLAQTGVPGAVEEAEELRSALADAQTLAIRGSTTVNALRGRYGVGTLSKAVLALLLLPAVLGILGSLDLSAITQTAAGLAAAVASVTAVVRSTSDGMKETIARITELDQELRRQVDKDPKVVSAKSGVDAAQDQLEEVRDREERLQSELAKLQEDLDKLTPQRQLAEFIISRRDADDYRKHLGLASVIRRDFDELAMLIARFNDDELRRVSDDRRDPSTASNEHLINRIVLYIDDLDRCPPKQVVKVLQAVHLLLAFPLFVVVVGVDARWLSRSLGQHYEGLLGAIDNDATSGGDAASPQDYLEKIFQIPFWLRPMSDDAKKNLLKALTTPTERVDIDVDSSDDTKELHSDGLEGDDSVESQPLQRNVTTAHPPPPGPPGKGQTLDMPASTDHAADWLPDDPAPAIKQRATDLRITPVTISEPEERRMMQFRPLLGGSPRALTRFVNVYRLIKAVKARQAPEESDPDVAMLLLAVVTGRPLIASELLDQVRRSGHSDDPTLQGAVDRTSEAMSGLERSTGEHRDLETVAAWLSGHPDWASMSVTDWNPVADDIARYSYRISR